jgi:predicted lipoprotein DUF2279
MKMRVLTNIVHYLFKSNGFMGSRAENWQNIAECTTKILLFLTITLLPITAHSQPALQNESQPDDGFNLRKYSALSASSAVFAATLIHSNIIWWKGNYSSFGFYDPEERGGWFDEPLIHGMDKIGHLYGSYLSYVLQKAILEWGGFDHEDARWYSVSFTMGLALLIEVADGFTDYSFDWRDLLMNGAGVLVGIGREEVPVLRHFNLKWSYIPTRWSFRYTLNYHASTFWLTADAPALLGITEGESFIQPAVGFSITPEGRSREFVVGLDFNLNKWLRSDNQEFEVLRKTLDIIHIPAPGIKYSPEYSPKYCPVVLR